MATPWISRLVRQKDDLEISRRELEGLRRQLDTVRSEVESLRRFQGWEPGHYYSPVPDLDDIRNRREEIFAFARNEIAGVTLNEARQLALLAELAPLIKEHPFSKEKNDGARYFFANEMFGGTDGLALYGMLQWLKPRRYLEIGSGFSSAIALDVNERHLSGNLEITLIEPYMDRLRTLMRPGDADRVRLLEVPVQSVPDTIFQSLEPNDVLFIDSTHVSKVGSDVNRIFFEILPLLPAGVYVHFHDIFFPFEYPQSWILEEKRQWNEDYMMRTFLQFNDAFEVVLFNDFLAKRHHSEVQQLVPGFLDDGGGSIWLRKTR
ncbi:MAG TPA: class I SAM-dependent methyltransferase [Polyangia bacterium]|jgi:predicted O-methyltransferase YrrM|nr:class I SAM-dependent methyltransferase [Polyangia bacterium]